MATKVITRWVKELRQGTFLLNDIQRMEKMRMNKVLADLSQTFPHKLLERRSGQYQEVGIAQSSEAIDLHRRGVRPNPDSRQTYQHCLFLTSELGTLTGLTLISKLRVRLSSSKMSTVEISSGYGISVFRDIDGWMLKVLDEKKISLPSDVLQRRGWLFAGARMPSIESRQRRLTSCDDLSASATMELRHLMFHSEIFMRVSIRIVAGDLRGRKVVCNHSETLRPTPQMVREAFFSILGNAIPDRVFVDIFAGTGVVGIESLSRDAKQALFIERDLQLAQGIERHLREFDLTRRAKLYRTDAYRWVAAWQPPDEPVNVFLSPPFVDLKDRPDEFVKAVAALQDKVALESVIVVQSERGSPIEGVPQFADWEERHYGRNVLLIWQKE